MSKEGRNLVEEFLNNLRKEGTHNFNNSQAGIVNAKPVRVNRVNEQPNQDRRLVKRKPVRY